MSTPIVSGLGDTAMKESGLMHETGDTRKSNNSSREVSRTSLTTGLASKQCLSSKKSSIVSTCRICLASFENPGVLSCGHKFCEECLYRYWKNGTTTDHIVCPLCRACAENIKFDEKKEITPEEFRNHFSEVDNLRKSNITSLCLKTSIIIPALYYLARLLKWLFRDTNSMEI